MRVLFINRPKKLWIGGDYIQMEKTAEELRKLGVQVDIEETPLPKPAIKMLLYDVVHIWNFSMPWSKLAVWASKSKKLKAVCSMIYHESDQWVPWQDQQTMLDELDGLIFLTEGEKERVKRHLKLDESKSHIIPNGLDESWFSSYPYRKGNYLLTVGRIEPSKGQLAVARVAKELGLDYICVGERTDENYAKMCEWAGAKIYQPKTPKQLKKIYAECSVYVLASRAELMPLTVMEAGAQGKQIVLTDHCEWQVPAEYVPFNDEKAIKEAILKQLDKGENVELRNMVEQMTWKSVAEKLKAIYESLRSNANPTQ